MHNKKETAELLLFELLDKIARFCVHIEEVDKQFYQNKDRKVQDKFLFINSFTKTLNKFIHLISILSENISTEDDIVLDDVISRIKHYINSLNNLHEKFLTDIPRPAEPIELRRFWRVIKKQAITLEGNQNKDISIFVNEEVGESAYPSDPLETFNIKVINACIEDMNSFIDAGFFTGKKIDLINVDKERDDYNNFHITMPRIDTNNPSKWPCLVHELSHKIFLDSYFEEGEIKDIESSFLASLSKEEKEEIESIIKEINLKSWLLESWCDLFASALIGPAFLFAQYSAFLNDKTYENKTHPPVLFRYKLIFDFLKHRFSKEIILGLEDTSKKCSDALKVIDTYHKHKTSDKTVRSLFQYFKRYFLSHFFIKSDGIPAIKPKELNDKLKSLVAKYIENIEWHDISKLITELNRNLPIPSKRLKANYYKEVPTTVQEIFLAGSIHRNNQLKESVLSNFKEFKDKANENSDDIKKYFDELIIKEFKRFDQSILRSIQVSEWFDVYLDKENPSEEELTKEIISNPSKSLLCDSEIEELIQRNEDDCIKIIPIMNFKKQLGTTSFDIRLGTSFEIYNTNQSGIVDFTDDITTKEAAYNSTKIDKDFLESITIMPGQFILGHSMEYIKLPDNVSGELGGRSSFARLGIEVHMTAGFVDPGFAGVLTFEIFNAGPNPVRLFPGLRIAQLRFIPINKPNVDYGEKHEAKYKGLLEHHISKQSNDYEIINLKRALEDNKHKNNGR